MAKLLPSFTEALGKLISLPSMSSTLPSLDHGNMAVLEQLAQWLETLGFKVDILPLQGQPHKANLIACRGTGPGGLVLAGHTDTVPYAPQAWNYDPLKLSEAQGRFHGLGSADMKGFFAVVLEALQQVADQNLRQPLLVLATADEEVSMQGARDLVQLGRPRARYAVIGEPTGLVPVRAHKGIMMQCLHARGRAAHSSDPDAGVSALEGMHQAIARLLELRQKLQRQWRDPDFKVPVPTMNLGHIEGGDSANRVCAHCSLTFDFRMLPGMAPEQIQAEIKQCLDQTEVPAGLELELEQLAPPVAPFRQSPGELLQAAEQLSGHSGQAVAFATEAPLLSELGMETIVLGPGHIAQAHQPDEYLEASQIKPAVQLITGMIQRFCLA